MCSSSSAAVSCGAAYAAGREGAEGPTRRESVSSSAHLGGSGVVDGEESLFCALCGDTCTCGCRECPSHVRSVPLLRDVMSD